MEVTEGSLASALEGFVVRVGSPVGMGTSRAAIADADETAAALYATLSRMAALRGDEYSPHELKVMPKPPSYYDGKTGMQPFDVIDEFGLDFYEGNVVKYVIRWRKKNGLEDLRKARTYLSRIIAQAEAAQTCEGGC